LQGEFRPSYSLLLQVGFHLPQLFGVVSYCRFSSCLETQFSVPRNKKQKINQFTPLMMIFSTRLFTTVQRFRCLASSKIGSGWICPGAVLS